MEYILMELFDGGSADWRDIADTEYDWCDIFETAKNYNGTDNIEDLSINDLYFAICYMAVNELLNAIEEYCNSANTKEEIALAEQIENISIEDFEIFANCLDTHITYIGENEEIIQKIFDDEIDEINNKIGFTYINFDN